MLDRFLTLITGLPVYHLKHKELPPAILAFTIKGVKYYYWDNFDAYPSSRLGSVLDAEMDIQNRADRDFLISYNQKLKESFVIKLSEKGQASTINLSEIANMIIDAEDRFKNVIWTDLLYNFGAYALFSEFEDPYIIDPVYTKKKKELFKKKVDPQIFFSVPIISDFLPQWLNIQENLQTYIDRADLANYESLVCLDTSLSKDLRDSKEMQNLLSLKAELRLSLIQRGLISDNIMNI